MTSNPVGLRSPVGGGSPDGLPGDLSVPSPGGGINGNNVIGTLVILPNVSSSGSNPLEVYQELQQ